MLPKSELFVKEAESLIGNLYTESARQFHTTLRSSRHPSSSLPKVSRKSYETLEVKWLDT